MDPTCRVTKDTSARKNTEPEKMHTALEMKAVKGAHETYLNLMTQGYDDKIEEMTKAHAAEIQELKAANSANEEMMMIKQQAAVDEAVRKALAGQATKITELQSIIGRLQASQRQLSNTLNETLEQKKKVVDEGNSEKGRLGLELEDTKRAHRQELARMRKKLERGPNSWVEITFRCKGRTDKEGVYRLHSTFADVLHSLSITKGIKAYNFDFSCEDVVIEDQTRTLMQLGIKDKAEIWYKRRSG